MTESVKPLINTDSYVADPHLRGSESTKMVYQRIHTGWQWGTVLVVNEGDEEGGAIMHRLSRSIERGIAELQGFEPTAETAYAFAAIVVVYIFIIVRRDNVRA